MVAAVCIACKRSFDIGTNPKKGHMVTCPHCFWELEIIRVNPPLLDWSIINEDIDVDMLTSRQTFSRKHGGKHSKKIISLQCISCYEKITVPPPIELGQYIYCDECFAELEIVNLSPVKVEWPKEDYDDFTKHKFNLHQNRNRL